MDEPDGSNFVTNMVLEEPNVELYAPDVNGKSMDFVTPMTNISFCVSTTIF